MKVSKQVATSNVSHDVFNRGKGQIDMGRVVHGKKDSGNNLKGKKKASQGTKASVVV